jgi:hypothetical protein
MRPIAVQLGIQEAASAAERANQRFRMPDALWQDVQELQRRADVYRKQIAPALVKVGEFLSRPEVIEAMQTYAEMTQRPQPVEPGPDMWEVAQLRYDSAARDMLLAEKDERIDVLERRLRSLMFPAQIGGDEYPPMRPEYFGEN